MTVANQNQVLATPFVTREALTFAVDYNAPSAVDPPSWIRFVNQAQITQFLTAKGATAFKHLQAVWDAIPEDLAHRVTLNLAAGVHRPRPSQPTNYAWDLRGKRRIAPGAGFTINGASPSSWTTVVAAQSVTAYQAASSNPYVDVSGTPYTGLDLKGYYAVFSTGQVTVIHDHTASRLFVAADISPSPVGGTVRVAKPSTVLRNSLTDTGRAHTAGLAWKFGDGDLTSDCLLANLTVEPFNINAWESAVHVLGGAWYGDYLLIDPKGVLDAFSVAPAGNDLGVVGLDTTCFVILNHVSVRGRGAGAGSYDAKVAQVTGGGLQLAWSYLRGSSGGIWVTSFEVIGSLGLYETVLDNVATSGTSIVVSGPGVLSMASGFYGGKENEMRGGVNAIGALHVMQGARTLDIDFKAKGFTAAVVQLGDNAHLHLPYSMSGLAIRDGGGNTTYGFDFQGVGSQVHLDPATDLTATTADVRMADGTEWALIDVVSAGPLIDTSGNIIRKDS